MGRGLRVDRLRLQYGVFILFSNATTRGGALLGIDFFYGWMYVGIELNYSKMIVVFL